MHLRWDQVLDRAWLGLAGAAALTVALHGGTQVGRRAWPPGTGGVLTAQAAPDGAVRPVRPGDACRAAALLP
jgi:hypothetical protein